MDKAASPIGLTEPIHNEPKGSQFSPHIKIFWEILQTLSWIVPTPNQLYQNLEGGNVLGDPSISIF